MTPLVEFIDIVLNLVTYVIIIGAVMSWLIGFNIVNRSNPLVWNIWQSVDRLTEPMYKPIRRRLPASGGLDFAPLVVLLIIMFIRIVVLNYILRIAP